MNPRVFPAALIALNVLAALACFAEGDARRGIYWLAAATLNATVTF